MNNVNKTLYIPLYGKAYVSRKNIILRDKKAEEIWNQMNFELKGKAKSKWLAYYMSMRAAIYDLWVEQELKKNPKAIVLHIGCGLDSRIERVSAENTLWYDIDFPEVVEERRKFYVESKYYHMIAADMRKDTWKEHIAPEQDAIIVLEGVSMYFKPDELVNLLSSLSGHFKSVCILMDCYTEKAAQVSKYKNPINEVGVTVVYGCDDPVGLADKSGLKFEKEYDMTPQKYINELQGMERKIFKNLFAGSFAKSMYRMYEFSRTG
ncbi:MAG: class I SAM-dependent methyltransferase [Lachnospiraceae bacterium]|nr:class I SAM-dependent methyltransferase [Lachnospiraceae bacterium]